MADDGSDQIADLLGAGWELAGYSVNMAAMGALMHNVLLKKGTDLTSIVIVTQGDSETGRNVNILSPRPAKKKGFFG
ncbi:MAG: hypothetical protein IPL38_18975 [Rhodobacter sp.]|nr:hypothetical protein [Rhodobacter sp.]